MPVDVSPRPREAEVYLGDGLYARFDGFQLEVYASNGVSHTNTVYLEPSVMRALVDYARRCGISL